VWYGVIEGTDTIEQWRAAVIAELEFLISLLPNETQANQTKAEAHAQS
jgi:hypothetical protein